MEFLESLFDEKELSFNQLKEAVEKHNTKPENKKNQIKIANLKSGSYVSLSKFKAKEKELSAAFHVIQQLQEDIKPEKNADQLEEELTYWKEKYSRELVIVQTESALDKALQKEKVRNAKAVRALLDESLIYWQDNQITGLEEQVRRLKKTDPYLFEEEKDAEHTYLPDYERTPDLVFRISLKDLHESRTKQEKQSNEILIKKQLSQ